MSRIVYVEGWSIVTPYWSKVRRKPPRSTVHMVGALLVEDGARMLQSLPVHPEVQVLQLESPVHPENLC